MVMWAGSAVGAVLGLVHAAYVYQIVTNWASADLEPNPTRGLYYALWTVGLWILFGSYVLILWLAGIVLYLVFKAFR